MAVNGSAGIFPMATLVTLKLTPQMRHTTSMPTSWARKEDGEDGEAGEDGEEGTDAGLVTPEE
jgi:hypothetical protein